MCSIIKNMFINLDSHRMRVYFDCTLQPGCKLHQKLTLKARCIPSIRWLLPTLSPIPANKKLNLNPKRPFDLTIGMDCNSAPTLPSSLGAALRSREHPRRPFGGCGGRFLTAVTSVGAIQERGLSHTPRRHKERDNSSLLLLPSCFFFSPPFLCCQVSWANGCQILPFETKKG